jgi:2-dehydro-3-deoxyphosphogluconate aldolase/(4S)-4-hydroxy-2-oxoglutarate aldolase
MTAPDHQESSVRDRVARSVARAPIFGVVRTTTTEEALRQARAFIDGGLELIEITFTVPGAAQLIQQLRGERGEERPPWIGAGTVTDSGRAQEALAHGAEFLLTPNVSGEVADAAHAAGVYLILGATTPTEIVAARQLGADLVKVYPLPTIGGPQYLATVRQPLNDIPMLAAGGFEATEIPAYREAGAIAFGIGSQLLGSPEDQDHRQRIQNALAAARGER